MKITIVAGARPNFMKIAPIIHAIEKQNSNDRILQYRLVHTGQHFDEAMSNTFFRELNIPEPHINLGGGGGSQAEQTANIMVAFEKDLLDNPADLVLVVGDVTSTMACSIVAKKLHTKVAHVEAGIRSFDMSMPEEINRLVTDSITDYYFTTTLWAGENLSKAGVEAGKVHFVGNVMIDTLLANESRFSAPKIWNELDLKPSEYLVMTLHRPGNVDEELKFSELLDTIMSNSTGLPVVFPVHPRTKAVIDKLISKQGQLKEGISVEKTGWYNNLHMIAPLGYLEFNFLVKHAKAVITDSGGITEETTVMGVPCLTLRENTERPETCEIGTNELIGTSPEALKLALKKLFQGQWKTGSIPEKWDGHSAERIVEVLKKFNG